MAQISIPGGGAGGLDPDELTAAAADVRKGKIAGVNGNDDPVTGTLDIPAANILAGKSIGGVAGTATSDANAYAERIYSGHTAYVNGNKITGNMTVNSILNFSAAAYSTTQILLQWQNPYAATGKPFSGVFINYSIGGYPGTGGTRIYTGTGNNAAAGGWSQAIVNMPSAGTGYYFSCTAYCSCSAGDFYGNTLNAYAATTAHGSQTFTSSGTFTVPTNVRSIDIFCVGGGGGGSLGGYNGEDADDYSGGAGGGGGYTFTARGISVSPGQQFPVTIGAGGAASNQVRKQVQGGTTSVGSYSAAGGFAPYTTGWSDPPGGHGGSGGGGSGWYYDSNRWDYGGNGGSNGSNGAGSTTAGGNGQGTTTRSFGDASGTLYSGGGGGGALEVGSTSNHGAGGAGGGGRGGGAGSNDSSPGSANTGGGGGGYVKIQIRDANASPGGSGIAIVRW